MKTAQAAGFASIFFSLSSISWNLVSLVGVHVVLVSHVSGNGAVRKCSQEDSKDRSVSGDLTCSNPDSLATELPRESDSDLDEAHNGAFSNLVLSTAEIKRIQHLQNFLSQESGSQDGQEGHRGLPIEENLQNWNEDDRSPDQSDTPWAANGLDKDFADSMDEVGLGSSDGSSPSSVLNHPNSPPLAMDLGCGSGSQTFALAERGWNAVGVDISEKAVEYASRQSAERQSTTRVSKGSSHFVQGNLFLPLELISRVAKTGINQNLKHSFDLILDRGVLHTLYNHAEKFRKTILELYFFTVRYFLHARTGYLFLKVMDELHFANVAWWVVEKFDKPQKLMQKNRPVSSGSSKDSVVAVQEEKPDKVSVQQLSKSRQKDIAKYLQVRACRLRMVMNGWISTEQAMRLPDDWQYSCNHPRYHETAAKLARVGKRDSSPLVIEAPYGFEKDELEGILKLYFSDVRYKSGTTIGDAEMAQKFKMSPPPPYPFHFFVMRQSRSQDMDSSQDVAQSPEDLNSAGNLDDAPVGDVPRGLDETPQHGSEEVTTKRLHGILRRALLQETALLQESLRPHGNITANVSWEYIVANVSHVEKTLRKVLYGG